VDLAIPSLRPLPVGNPVPQGGAFSKIAIFCLWILVLNLVARLTELAADILHLRVRFVLALAIVCFLASLASGAYTRIFPSKIAVLFTLLAGWVILSVPFAVWRGGSAAVMVESWFLTVAVFYLVAGTPINLKDCAKLMTAMGVACALLLLASLHYSKFTEGRGGLDLPSLANPNLFALQLLYGLPFCPLLYRRFPRAVSVFIGTVVLAYSNLILIRTGSRSALISLVVLFILLFVVSSVRRKIVLIAFIVVSGLLVLSSSSVALSRFQSLFGGPPDSIETASAKNSSDLRWKLFMQALEVTAENPLFGVGPGNFTVASFEMKREDISAAAWLGSHNTPTQFSSETGAPAGLLFLALVFGTLYMNTTLYLKTRNSGSLAADLSLALLFSTIATFVMGLFASIAYQFYFPLLFGLTVAVDRTSRQEQPALAPARSPLPARLPTTPVAPPARVPTPAPVYPKLRRPPRYLASKTGQTRPIPKP
jgi:O-antigen ligase